MDVFLYCIALIFLGYISFCFPIGIMVFKKLCVRSQYEKKSVIDSTSHVKDEKIMKPLLEAKERWSQYQLEKLIIPISSSGGFGFLLKGSNSENLCADLLMHKKFSKNKTLAILAHGFTDSASGLAYLAESYYEREVSVLSLNLRGHGESGGSFSGLGSFHTDGKDVASWVQYVKKKFGKDVSIILHGVSMGGASVIQGAFFYSLPVALVVSDCSFSDYSTNVKNLVQNFFPKNWFSTWMIFGIYKFAAVSNVFVNGFSFEKNCPKRILSLSSHTIPLLLFHGEKDSLVNSKYSYELYDAAKEPRKIVVVKKAPHIGSWFYDKEKYMNEVFNYLQDCN